MGKNKSVGMLLLLRILLAVAILGAVFFAWRIVTTERAYIKAESAYEEIAYRVIAAEAPENLPESDAVNEAADETSKVNWKALWELAPDAVAWLSCEDGISYPVMQGEDNEFYLHHLADGTYSFAGSLYVDYRCAGDFSGRNTVLYGHNMNDGSMFSFLKNYREQTYYDKHSSMRLDTPDGGYTLELLAGYVQYIDSAYELPTDFLSEEEIKSYVEQAQQGSTFASEQAYEAGDKLVTLVSCTPSSKATERYFVVCRMVDR